MLSTFSDLCLGETADAVFLGGLYSVLYLYGSDEQREQLLKSIRHVLKPDGCLLILEQGPRASAEGTAPSRWISPDLVIEQLRFHAFELEKARSLDDGRYLLRFHPTPPANRLSGTPISPEAVRRLSDGSLEIQGPQSLLHLGTASPSNELKLGGQLLLGGIEKGDRPALAAAQAQFERAAASSPAGDELGPVRWFAEILLGEKEPPSDPVWGYYYRFFAKDNFAELRWFLRGKYSPDGSEEDDTADARRLWSLQELLCFQSPVREEWEKSSVLMENLGVEPGQAIADIGSGPGFHTFQFANKVGPAGCVFAVETNPFHITYLTDTLASAGIHNVRVVRGKEDDLTLEEKTLDLAFMCSVYHMSYAMTAESERLAWLQSIKKALKPNGRLAVVDNAIVPAGAAPYRGPRIAKELIVAQLERLGFRLMSERLIVPQRYLLIFKSK